MAKFVTRQRRVIYSRVGANLKLKPIRSWAIARFAYSAWEIIVIPVGNVIVCKQGRTHYNHNLNEEEDEE